MKKQRIVRLLALLCTLASLLSSVAFAAVTLPDVPPDSQTYVVVPYNQNDYGMSMFPNLIEEKKVPVRVDSKSYVPIVNSVDYFDYVYTASGEEALVQSTGSMVGVRLNYDASLIGVAGYICAENLVPKLQMRKVSYGQGNLNYYASADDVSTSSSLGSLAKGTKVRLISADSKVFTDVNGVSYTLVRAKIHIYFPNATSGAKYKIVYVDGSGLTSY